MRRRGKEWREQAAAAFALVLTSPLFAVIAVAIKFEGLVDRDARGRVFFTEDRVSRGRVFGLLKFRTLRASALAELDLTQPTHIKSLEADRTTRVGHVLKQWYLDELPQLINIVKGEMFLIGTRPWPIELYDEEMARGITRKRDMPAGLIGPVQAAKGTVDDPLAQDLAYWRALQELSSLELLRLDARIVVESLKTMLEHKGL